MHRYIFIKPVESVTLGQIYQHVIAIGLSKNMVDRGFYTGVDYQIKSQTHSTGLVVVELMTYGSHPKHPKLKFSETNLDVAIRQLSIELKLNLEVIDRTQLLSDLTQLDRAKWFNLDDFNSLDTSKNDIKPYENIKTKALAPKKMSITTSGADIDSKNLPLARHLWKIIATNVAERLGNTSGLVAQNIIFDSTADQPKLSSTLLAGKEIDLEKVNEIIKDTTYNLRYTGALARLKTSLRLMSYAKTPASAVDFDENYQDTLVAIGSKGWRKLASRKNIKKVLQQTRFEVQFGKDKISLEV